MRNIVTILIVILYTMGLGACSHDLELISAGKSDYVIVIPQSPTMTEQRAAKELNEYLDKMAGVMLPVVEDNAAPAECEISIGNTNRIIPLAISSDKLEQDGFYIKTNGRKLYIMGGNSYGTLYGVYELLEKYLGCRKYTPTVEVVPQRTTVTLPVDIDDWQVPAITSRNMLYVCANDNAFFDWLRLTQTPTSWVDRGKWGLWVHTFGTLVPPEKYFNRHPEYFAMNEKGERVPSQLCLSNPELLDVLCKELDSCMSEKPEALYWSVSQNDNYNYCKCDACQKAYEEEESPSGLLIRFINKVAGRYPDKIISTLAYQFTRKAPKLAKPAANVNIMFCNIECNRSKPIPQDTLSAGFRKDMDDWAKISRNILLWDYIVQFSNLYTPFPNFRTLQPNMQYFAGNHVTSVFSQGNPEPAGEMCYLRAYVAAKLLWNPDCDLDAVIDDFLAGYYGKAGQYIKEYMTLLHDNLEKSGEELSIFGNALTPINGYLSPENLDAYNKCFDRAEAAVSGDKELTARVQFARLPVIFTELEQANLMPVGKHGFLVEGEDGSLSVNGEFLHKLDHFIVCCKENHTRRLCEWMTPVDEYKEEMTDIPQQYLKFLAKGNKALGKPVTVNLPLTQYRAKGALSLTDGMLGGRNYNENWLGFKHDDFEITVDLEKNETVSEVDARFIQSILDRLFLPEGMEVSVSSDNRTYKPVGQTENKMDRKKNYKTKVFGVRFAPCEARYIKVKVKVVPVCPMWHRDAKSDVWTMLDEIAIR